MKLQIKVNPLTGIIDDAKFKTFGCGSAIASSSLATEWLKGKTVEEALAIKNTDIVNELALPPVKIHCSVLAEDAIKAAITDYKVKQGADVAALDFTSLLNDAWRVFRDPVARAEYVLKLLGYDTADSRTNTVPAELLEEVFELNMALEEARDGDSGARKQVAEALTHFTALRQDLDVERDRIFAAYDAAPADTHLETLRSLLNRRRYIDNLVRDAQQALS